MTGHGNRVLLAVRIDNFLDMFFIIRVWLADIAHLNGGMTVLLIPVIFDFNIA